MFNSVNSANHNVLKVPAIIFLLLLHFIVLDAQFKRPMNDPGYDYKRLHFGFTVGINTMDMGLKRNLQDSLWADISRLEPGFQVSIVSDLRINNDLTLRFLPGIAFGQRNLSYFNYRTKLLTKELQIASSYLDFPLHLKYRAKRLNNYRPYLIGGVNYRFDMAARKEYSEEDDILVRFNPSDIYIEAGFGIDFYLPFFKFAPEIKVGMGMLNLRVDNPSNFAPQYVRSTDVLKSYVVMLNFHFE